MPVSSIIAAVLNVVLNFIFIRMFGYYAAGYTTLVCYIVYSVGHYSFSKIVCQKHIHGQKLFETEKIVSIAVVLVLCAIGVNFLYAYRMLRFLLGAAAILLVVWQRKRVTRVLKEIRRK